MWSSRFKRCHKYNVTNMYIMFIFKPFDLREILILTMTWHHNILKTYYWTLVAQNQSMKMCQITGSDVTVPLTQHKTISSHPIPHMKPITWWQRPWPAAQLHANDSNPTSFVYMYASVAFRSDRNSLLFLNKLNCKKWKEIKFLSTRL